MKKDTVEKILELQRVKGMTAKREIIRKNRNDDEFLKVLYYSLHPYMTYKVSERTLRAASSRQTGDSFSGTIFDLCEMLSRKKAVDSNTIGVVKRFIEESPEYERELLTTILSKTIRLGVTAKTVNMEIDGGLVPEWGVQEAYPIDNHPIRDGEWFTLTQKLNGFRATYYGGELRAKSGEVYSGLEHITSVLDKLYPNYVFDGELLLANRDGLSDNEAFRKAGGIINSDSEYKTEICYMLYDVLETSEFDLSGVCHKYSTRRETLNEMSKSFQGTAVSVLPVLYQGTDQSVIPVLLDQMVREDKEGLVANLDVPYKRTRHAGILKIKKFYTMDLPIVGYEEGSGRLSGTLGALMVDFKGSTVKVGSGFSDSTRADLWGRRDELMGVLCEVKYKEISKNKSTGKESLQFPVFIQLRTDKTEVSFG